MHANVITLKGQLAHEGGEYLAIEVFSKVAGQDIRTVLKLPSFYYDQLESVCQSAPAAFCWAIAAAINAQGDGNVRQG